MQITSLINCQQTQNGTVWDSNTCNTSSIMVQLMCTIACLVIERTQTHFPATREINRQSHTRTLF